MVKKELLYTKEHEWAKIEGDTATVGITDHAQEMLGEITFVELPAVGQEFTAHDEMAVVESSKAASDIYSPVSGKAVEVNTELEAKPELVNQDCYNQGWICKLKITDKTTLSQLMDADQYEQFLKEI
jgi:glycine cleavage system H protein